MGDATWHERDTLVPHTSQRTERHSYRPLVALLLLFTLLATADVAVTWVRLSALEARGVPGWRGEWNPLMQAVIRTQGFGVALALTAPVMVVVVLVTALAWRGQWGEGMQGTASQQAIRTLVIGSLVVACVFRLGVVGYNVSLVLGNGASWPPNGSPAAPRGSGTATSVPSPSALPSASPSSPVPTASPTRRTTPTPVPTTTITPSPTPSPTPTPTPQPTPSPTPCQKHCP